MDADKGRVARAVNTVDKLLSILILIMGIFMMYLAIQYSSVSMVLVSLVFMGIGFFKLRSLFPDIFRHLRKGSNKELPPYRNILLPVSGQDSAERLIRIARDIMAPDGGLNLISVVEVPPQLPPETEAEKDQARTLLRTASGLSDKYGVRSKASLIMAVTAPEAIVKMSRKDRSDLIILDSVKRTASENMNYGNVADTVLKQASCDVMVLSHPDGQYPARYEKILVPMADLMYSLRALEVALDLAEKSDGKITWLYAGRDTDAKKGKRILEEARLQAEKRGVQTDSRFVTGDVVDNMVSLASDGNYSLIIIGARARQKYAVMPGAAVDDAIKKAPCDVLVVRTRE